MANHKRYGPGNGKGRLSLADYHQSKDNLRDLPQTQVEKIPVTNTPNIFSYKSYVFAKKPHFRRSQSSPSVWNTKCLRKTR